MFPIAKEIGIHPVHFNIVLTAAVGIGLFLPPIGVGLLMALRFANITVGQHFRAYWPYLLALFVGLLILILFPEITLFLPRRAGMVALGRSDTAPPGRSERRGGMGGQIGPKRARHSRGATRLRRGAPSAGGVWGAISGPPMK